MRPGKWWQPNKDNYQKNNYNYSNTKNGNIPVVTTSSYTAAAGNSSYGGWNDWQDWGDDNGDYQPGYGDGQDHSWEAQDDQPYESTVRVPYQREVYDGETLTKMTNNKARKKAKVDKDPKR